MSFLLLDIVFVELSSFEKRVPMEYYTKYSEVILLLIRMWRNVLMHESMSLKHMAMTTLSGIIGRCLDLLLATSSSNDDECVDDGEFEFAIGDGVRGTSMKKCEWLHEMADRADKYCETKGFDPDAMTMIKSACRSVCADYLSECL